jgi:polyisoprenoid-binding protein YceI
MMTHVLFLALTHFVLDGNAGKDLVSFVSDAPVEQFVGRTSNVSGSVDIDLADVTTGKVDFTVDLSTLSTGIDGRDKHMKSAEYLNTDKFPKATFKSTKINLLEGDKALGPNKVAIVELTGDLTIRGVTRPLTTKAFVRYLKGDAWSQKMLGPGDILSVSAHFPIKITDFGMKVPQYIILKVNNEVQINVKVNARTSPSKP